MSNFLSKSLNSILATLVLVGLLVALTAYAYYTFKQVGQGPMGPTTITVVGVGEATATPDIASFSFSVTATGTDATAAQAASADKMNAIMSYLTESGIEARDIKTENYSLYPNYRYEQRPCTVNFCPPGEQVADGFQASQMVSVKVRQPDQAGTLLAGVGERGATDISGLGFTVDDEEAVKTGARELAIQNAKAQAEALAEQLDVELVKLIGFYEDVPYPTPYYSGMGGAMDMSAKAESAPVIPTGENMTTVRVNLTYQISQ